MKRLGLTREGRLHDHVDDPPLRLGRHLEVSVRTGTYCSYRPEEPVVWDVAAR